MPIPTELDRTLAALDDLHNGLLARLRIYHRAGRDRDPAHIRVELQGYADAVIAFLNGDDRCS